MKNLLFFVATLSLVSTTFGKDTILAAGDSITNGYAVPVVSTGVLQSDGMDVNFINDGHGGMCTAQYIGDQIFVNAKNNYALDAANRYPDYIYFMLGTNDSFYSSTYLANFQSNIDRIFSTWKNGPHVYVATVLPMLYSSHDIQNQAIEEIINPAIIFEANKFGFTLIDTHTLIQQQPNWENFYAADGLHIWGVNGNANGSRWLMHTFNAAYLADKAATRDWNGRVSTDWSDPNNWTPGSVLEAGTQARFGNQDISKPTVSLPTGTNMVGSIEFKSNTSTTIMGSPTSQLVFDNASFRSTIDTEGSHSILVPIVLNNDLKFSGNGNLMVSSLTGNYSVIITGGSLTASSIAVDSLVIKDISSLAVVPEPSTTALLFPAILGGLLWWRRRSFVPDINRVNR